MVAAGAFLLLFFLLSRFIPVFCPFSRTDPPPSLPPVPQFFIQTLQHGDLFFREGKTLASEVARKASLKDQRFSHVGIIVKEKNELFVIHAIHDEKKGFRGVVQEELAGFLADGNHFGAYRVLIEEEGLQKITQKAKILAAQKTPYDHDYNLEDPASLYCTEFVFHLLRDLPGIGEMKTTTFLGKEVIAIENIYENKEFFEMIIPAKNHGLSE